MPTQRFRPENLLSRAPAWAVEFILDLLAGGWSKAEILQNYPRLTHEDIQAYFELRYCPDKI